MKFRIRFADQVVGVFILLALAGVIVLLFLLGANQRWFARSYDFSSRFTTANGASVGASINLRGFEIGKVTRVELSSQNLVDVHFSVYDEYIDKVTKNSVLELSTSPIGLGTSILFHSGLSIQRLPEHSYIPSMDLPEGRDLVDHNLVDIPKKDDTISRLLAGTSTVMDDAHRTLVLLNQAMDGSGTGPIRDVIDNSNKVLLQFNETMSALQTAFVPLGTKAQDMVPQINAILAQTNAIMDDLKGTADAMKDPTGLVTRLIDPKGSMQTLLNDNGKLWNQLNEILDNVNLAVKDLQATSSGIADQVPKLSALILDTRSAISSAQDVMEGLKNNPLLRGGISPKPQQEALFESLRKDSF